MYQKSVLPNGVRLLTEALPHCQTVALGLWLEVGSRDETPGEGGLSHFLEHMAFKGTGRRTALELAREIDQLGGLGNAFTTRESTCFHFKVLGERLPEALDLLMDLGLNPAYHAEDVERERTVILEEIAAQEDNPEELVQVEFARQFWRDCPLGHPILGEREDVSRYSREDLLAFREATYRPETLIIAAAGKVTHEEILKLVQPVLEAFTNGTPPRKRQPAASRPGVFVLPRDLEQVHVCFGTRGVSAGDPRRFAASVLHVILGGNMSSRLFQLVREELGLAYNIYSYLSFFQDTGLLEICAGVNPANLPRLLEVTGQELKRLKDQAVSDAELRAAKEYLRNSILLNADDCEQRMLRLAKNEINFGHYIPLEDILAGVEKVSKEEVQELARDLFLEDQWGLALLGPVAEGEWRPCF